MITIAVAGKFHAFSLAKEFAALGKLERLFCVSRTIRPPKGIPAGLYANRLDLALRTAAQGRVPLIGISFAAKDRIFDRWIAERLRNSEPGVLHGWNGCMNGTFRALSGSGWVRCVERSCPHNQIQYDLLTEEGERLGLKHFEDPERLRRSIEELYEADLIICPSKYSERSYSDPELRAKLRRVPLGANYPFRERPEPRRGGPRILMVGNSFLRKGTHYLVEAMKFIESRDARLFIRGDVPPAYRRRINDPRIQILGPLWPAQLRELYANSDVFVQPSIDEGFGMTVLEALSYGLPLVATENVGCCDLLSDRVSVKVPIRSSEAIAEAIPRALALVGSAFDAERRRILATNSWRGTAERLLSYGYQRSVTPENG